MSFGFGFALPAYQLRGGGGNNPFNQNGPTLDLSFTGVVTDLTDPNGYTLNTNFITPQYQIAAQYVIWETGVGLVDKTFSQIITFSRASGATWFNSAGNLIGVDFSTSSNTIGTGSKTFTLDATAGVNRSWATGDSVLIVDQANSANNMTGAVTSYTASTQTLVVNVTSTAGSGTITSWRIGSTMPRFDYNPATLAAQGLLIEEARTNSIRNNTMQGAVAGTPGTAPNNWGPTTSTANGITRTIVGTGIENGITYIDIQYAGTATANGNINISADQNNFIAALQNQVWTFSAYFRLVGGSFANLTTNALYINSYTSGGAFDANATSVVSNYAPTGSALNTQRYFLTGTLSSATTAFVNGGLFLTYNNGAVINFTLRIGLPQLENNNLSTGVASATVASGGSGYAVGDVLQIVGGTGSTAARLTVATLSGSAVATVTVSTAGLYSVFPSPQPVSVTAITGTGTSATFNIVPQTQAGFATSVIPTTTTALTRSADVASVNTLSPWFNASAGTMYFEGITFDSLAAAFPRAYQFNDGTNNFIQTTRNNGSGAARMSVVSGGVAQAAADATAWTLNATTKAALAYATNDFAIVANGGAATTDTSGTVPTVTNLLLGSSVGGVAQINGYLRRITYYPRRLSNAELQAITTP